MAKTEQLSVMSDSDLRHTIYRKWLDGEGIDLSESTPQEIMDKLASQKVHVQGMGDVSPVEMVILNYLAMAMSGHQGAMEKVYNELQHRGITKVQQVAPGTLSKDALMILQLAGIVDGGGNVIPRVSGSSGIDAGAPLGLLDGELPPTALMPATDDLAGIIDG